MSPFLSCPPPHVGLYRLWGLTGEESEEEWDGGRKEDMGSKLVLELWP